MPFMSKELWNFGLPMIIAYEGLSKTIENGNKNRMECIDVQYQTHVWILSLWNIIIRRQISNSFSFEQI